MAAVAGAVSGDLTTCGLFAGGFGRARSRSRFYCGIVVEANWDIRKPIWGVVDIRTGVHDTFLVAVAGEFVLRFIDKSMYPEPLMWDGGEIVIGVDS